MATGAQQQQQAQLDVSCFTHQPMCANTFGSSLVHQQFNTKAARHAKTALMTTPHGRGALAVYKTAKCFC